MFNKLKNLLSSFLDLIYKKKCYFCNSSKYSLKMCPNCFEELNYTQLRPSRIINGVNIYSCGIYEKNLQKLIRGIKYHKQKELAFYLAKFMYEYWAKFGDIRYFQVIPVPLHPNRLKKRKYNHMELVGEEFCKLSGYELNTQLITRIKDTKPQYKLSKQERIKNLSNAFKVDINNLKDKPILIIDDISTTGTTFEEMIKELQKYGITDIICISASSPNN